MEVVVHISVRRTMIGLELHTLPLGIVLRFLLYALKWMLRSTLLHGLWRVEALGHDEAWQL